MEQHHRGQRAKIDLSLSRQTNDTTICPASLFAGSAGKISSIFYHQVSLIHRHFLQYIHYVDKQTKFPLILKIMLHIVMNNVVYNQQIGINDENTDLFRNCR